MGKIKEREHSMLQEGTKLQRHECEMGETEVKLNLLEAEPVMARLKIKIRCGWP